MSSRPSLGKVDLTGGRPRMIGPQALARLDAELGKLRGDPTLAFVASTRALAVVLPPAAGATSMRVLRLDTDGNHRYSPQEVAGMPRKVEFAATTLRQLLEGRDSTRDLELVVTHETITLGDKQIPREATAGAGGG